MSLVEDTKKWISVEWEISDSTNASVGYSLPEELCIIKAPTNQTLINDSH